MTILVFRIVEQSSPRLFLTVLRMFNVFQISFLHNFAFSTSENWFHFRHVIFFSDFTNTLHSLPKKIDFISVISYVIDFINSLNTKATLKTVKWSFIWIQTEKHTELLADNHIHNEVERLISNNYIIQDVIKHLNINWNSFVRFF